LNFKVQDQRGYMLYQVRKWWVRSDPNKVAFS